MDFRYAHFFCSKYYQPFSRFFSLLESSAAEYYQVTLKTTLTTSKMGLISTLYNNILRRSSTYALAIVTGAFFFERGFDLASENLYNEINRGVLIIP